MKKFLLQFLPILATLLLLVSCQKTDDVILDKVNPQPTAEEFIDKHIDQNVVFQYSELDEQGRLTQGWVIDKNGHVMSFSFDGKDWGSEDYTCSFDDMAQLEAVLSTELGQVDLEELVKHYKSIEVASQTNPKANYNAGEATTAFFAYRLRASTYQSNYSHSCGEGEESRPFVSPYYDQVLLYQDGSQEISNVSNKARAMTQWLQEVQIEHGR